MRLHIGFDDNGFDEERIRALSKTKKLPQPARSDTKMPRAVAFASNLEPTVVYANNKYTGQCHRYREYETLPMKATGERVRNFPDPARRCLRFG